MFGAGNETRTRDPDLGKVVLYQLSYSRKVKLYRIWRETLEAFHHLHTATALCFELERETRLELATPTLARSCSTN